MRNSTAKKDKNNKDVQDRLGGRIMDRKTPNFSYRAAEGDPVYPTNLVTLLYI